jgi:hypothetical protein
MSVYESGSCYRCGRTLNADDYPRGSLCPGCRCETRCCRNCEFYDPRLNNECKENQADRVVDKEKSVFCEFFRASAKVGASADAPKPQSAEAKAKTAFDTLFKKKVI